jgi:hypothetical protein
MMAAAKKKKKKMMLLLLRRLWQAGGAWSWRCMSSMDWKEEG